MFDDFFIRALIAGIGIAIVAGPLGCLVIWRRLSYFGDTLSHSALLGVTLAYSFSINISLSVFIVSGIIALLLLNLQKRTKLPGDALLGLLAHSTLGAASHSPTEYCDSVSFFAASLLKFRNCPPTKKIVSDGQKRLPFAICQMANGKLKWQ